MKLKHLLLFSLLILPSVSAAQTADKPKYILLADSIFNIMETSMRTYEPEIVDSVEGIKRDYPRLNDQLYLYTASDSSIQLLQYELSEEALKCYKLAEEEYNKHNYDKAVYYYRELLKADPAYNKAYTMIGDMYYMKKDYDSARYYFTTSIEKNYADYTAHWFLADAYYASGQPEKALEEITIAHLLNRNHESILNGLKRYRKANYSEWKNWNLDPECRTYQEGENYIIETTEDWLGYAAAEAVWKFEPGFAEEITGEPFEEGDIRYEKEAGCIAANIGSANMRIVGQILEDGYFEEMIWYERLSKMAPSSLLLAPRPFFMRIVEYVNKYH